MVLSVVLGFGCSKPPMGDGEPRDSSAAADSEDGSDSGGHADSGDPTDSGEPSDSGEPQERVLVGELSQWDWPLEDWIAAQIDALGDPSFLWGLADLAVHEDQLYLGYGDYDRNTGPIEVLAYSSPDPTSLAPVFTVDEEAIERFRVVEGALMIPGIDGTEGWDAGSVYSKAPGADWVKDRSLQDGVHVYDVAQWGHALYAAGATAAGARLWMNDGSGWAVRADILSGRSQRLIPLDDALFVLGYTWDPGYTDQSARLDADGIESWEGLPDVQVTSVAVLSGDSAFVAGLSLPSWKECGAWTLNAAGDVAPIEALDERCVLDVWPHELGLLVLSSTEDSWNKARPPWEVHVDLLRDESLEPVFEVTSEMWPISLAWWDDALYVGDWTGQLWRAEGD